MNVRIQRRCSHIDKIDSFIAGTSIGHSKCVFVEVRILHKSFRLIYVHIVSYLLCYHSNISKTIRTISSFLVALTDAA